MLIFAGESEDECEGEDKVEGTSGRPRFCAKTYWRRRFDVETFWHPRFSAILYKRQDISAPKCSAEIATFSCLRSSF